MKILATILSTLLLTVAAHAVPDTYHLATVSGVVNVQGDPIFGGTGSAVYPVKVTNALIIKEAVLHSGSGSGVTASNLSIVMNDNTKTVSIYDKGHQNFLATVATSGTGASDTPFVVAANKKGEAKTYVESDYELDFTTTLLKQPITVHIVSDVLFHLKLTTGGVFTSASLSLIGGGSEGGHPFYFLGTIKTGKAVTLTFGP